jgi:ribosomal protein S18 acetylase RimI-like enzyme
VTEVLRNAVWHSLIGPQSDHAEEHGLARRFHPDVSVFYAIDEPTSGAWDDLAALAQGEVVVLFREAPLAPAPQGWKQVFQGEGYQMVLDAPSRITPPLPATDPKTGQRVSQRALAGGDVDVMIDLVARTEPGPFRPRTIELGGYLGIFHDDTLVAMAGRRFHLPGFVEVSAVCTDPSARRRGYGAIVTALVADQIAAEGNAPMLHVAQNNDSARSVYEQLGFTISRSCEFAAFRAPRPPR